MIKQNIFVVLHTYPFYREVYNDLKSIAWVGMKKIFRKRKSWLILCRIIFKISLRIVSVHQCPCTCGAWRGERHNYWRFDLLLSCVGSLFPVKHNGEKMYGKKYIFNIKI